MAVMAAIRRRRMKVDIDHVDHIDHVVHIVDLCEDLVKLYIFTSRVWILFNILLTSVFLNHPFTSAKSKYATSSEIDPREMSMK